MDNSKDKGTNLDQIFTKLGHEIEEIRCRALANLLSKLEHRLIQEADLIQERHLLIRLLEWFNFRSCPQKEEVLSLIRRLAKHSSASEHLVKIGAVQFLSLLRHDIEDGLQASIDGILELLLSLPGDVTCNASYEHCFYEAQATGHNGDVIQDSASFPRVSPRSLTLSPDMANGYFHLGPPSPPGIMKNKSRRALLQDQCPGSEGICGVIFSTFPWLPLTATDVHVLTSTNNSLCSSEAQVVMTSCDFINDVVLHDFPAEIFLQRPNIIQSLLALLADHRQDDDSKARVTQHAIRCLTNISILLMARFQFYHDPALYCPKQEFLSRTNSTTSSVGGEQSHSTIQSTLSSESRPSIIGRTNRRVSGDGRDWDSHSSVGSSPPLPGSITPPPGDPETDSDDTIVLQFSQVTLPQFTLSAMIQALSLLKVSSMELTSHLFHLLHRTFRLLSVAMTADIWQDKSVSGRLLTDKLSECLESMGGLIHHHYQSANNGHMTSQQRMHHIQIYQVLASFTLAVINQLAPLSKAQDLLPEELSTALGLLLVDAGFSLAYPECIKNLQNYVKSVSPEQDEIYNDMEQIISSMQSACALVTGSKTMKLQEQVEMAQEACVAWSYHRMADVIKMLVQVSSDICISRGDSSNDETGRSCRSTLLHYLAHPDPNCRLHMYRACLKITKDSLQVVEAIHPRSEVSHHVTFLLDPSILHEIACYGLDDSNEEVQKMSESILLTLLHSRLLMSQALWDKLLQAFIPIMPLLQAHASSHLVVSQCANDLIIKCRDPAVFGSYSRLPALEQIRGGLRMLFSKDFRVRAEASATLLWHLLNEPEAELKRPTLSPPPSGVEDLFIFHTKASLENHNGMSVFQEDGLLQVFNIFTSENTERDLKKSALQQMAIILQDSRLHHTFVSHGGLEKMMETLATVIIPTAQSSMTCELVPPIISILRHLVHANTARRRKMAHQSGLFLMLLRASLICRGSEEARQEIAHLLILLIFDETITMATDSRDSSRKVCFPLVITQHFQLPFRCGITSSSRPHRLAPRPSPDPLRQPENWSRIKLEWMKAWTTGQDGLRQALLHDNVGRNVEYSSELLLEPEERALLATSYPPTCLQQSLQTILAATSHFTVKQAICQLSLMKQWASLQQSRGVTEGGEMTSLTRALLSFDWKAALNRFLEVIPANNEDEQLLAHLLSLLSQLLRSPDLVTPDLIEWVGSTCSGGRLSLVELLGKYPPAGQMGEGQTDGGAKGKESSQALVRKEILRLLTCFVQNLPLSQDAWRRRGMFLGGSLVHGLLRSLDLADALHFYDLPSLESTLHCLVHVTARPGWSLDWADGDSLTLCQQMLTSLQEVVSAFHVGRGGTAMSYMGKGVTKSATLCLLHLTREMAARAVDKNWPMEWLYTSKGSSEAGFAWLTPLLSYRDPEVRAAGLGIAASLASSEQGCVSIATCFQQRTGGVWGLALSVLLDHSECSVVRQQAASFLANLLLQPFSTDDPPKGQKVRPSDHQQKIGVAGLSAVNALLQYHRFFPEIATMLTHYYPDSTIQPISVVEDSTLPSSSMQSGPPTLTTPDSSENEDSVRPSLSRGQSSQVTGERRQPVIRSPEGQSISSSQDTISTSSSGVNGGRYESVVTPGLVTSSACLLTNLLAVIPSDAVHAVTKENILQTIQGIINVNRIQSLLQQATPSSSSEDHTPLTTDSAHSPTSHYASQVELCRQSSMCTAVLRLCLACLQQDTATVLDAMHDGKLITKCCQILALQLPEQGDTKLAAGVHELWRISFEFLTMICHLSGLEDMNPILERSWKNITDCIISVVSRPSPATTRTTALNFLSIVLKKAEEEEETRRSSIPTRSVEDGCEEATEGQDEKSLLARLLDERKEEGGPSAGSELCDALLKAYDGSLPRSTGSGLALEKPAVFSALKVLLAISDTAKSLALAAGLVETTVDTLRQIHTKLTLESLHMNKTSAKKKEDPMFSELQSSFDLLNSIMINSHHVKMAAHQAGLGMTIHKLWAWLGMDIKLMTTTLLLLTTYTARCPVVCAAIASSGPGQTGNSILHYLIRLVERERLKVEKGSEFEMLAKVFSILGNLVWFGECRNVLWKSGFLGSFMKVKLPRSSKQTKNATNSHMFAALWLQLLTNLTFATEGQQMVMRIPDALDLLIDFAQCPVPPLQDSALLVLHNLCYLAVNKTRLLANDKLVNLFLTSLSTGNLKTQYTVTSALYALIYDSQKAKALLKPSCLTLSLQELEVVLQKEMQRPQPPATLIEATRRDMAARCQFVTSSLTALLQD